MDDLLVFCDEEAPSVSQERPAWQILIVDDEPNVHKATRFALEQVEIEGRPLSFTSVYSAAEAKQVLQDNQDIACILLDVVMESEDAGLKLVNYIRNELDNTLVRIILRTGQPGYAPESQVIMDYDINNYESKVDLTKQRLLTSLISALRSYQQLTTISNSSNGLQKVIKSTAELFKIRRTNTLAEAVIRQVSELLEIPSNGVACTHTQGMHGDRELLVLAATGDYTRYHFQALETSREENLTDDIYRALATRESLYYDDRIVLYLDRPNADHIVVRLNTAQPLNEVEVNLLSLYINVTVIGFDNVKMFNEVEYLAYHDPLTGLTNRTRFLQEIRLRLNNQSEQQFMLVLANIVGFQAVNDGLGSEIGDKVLTMTGQLLKHYSPHNQCIARLGGDLFGLILPYEHQLSAKQRLQAIIKRFSIPLIVDKNHIPVNLVVGACFSQIDGASADLLIRRASVALKQAKKQGNGGFCFYDAEMSKQLAQRLHIIHELRPAVHNNEFTLQYQPQMNLKTGQPVGCEALVRWRKQDGSLIPPMEFISAAEESGLIVDLGNWVLRTACEQQVKWYKQGLGPIRMAVNVSVRQFQEQGFVEGVIDIINETGIRPEHLELEITESVVMSHFDQVTQKLQALRDYGILVAMDDFGTGYSSLSYLQKLPLDRIKIDRSFVQYIHQRSEDTSIASMIVSMGHELGLSVLAEGIEEQVHQQILEGLGCDEAQGYFFAKPLDSGAMEQFFAERQDENRQPDWQI